jgi:membrane-bound metal-dependent hydrolase YbcI (DUF457 family)
MHGPTHLMVSWFVADAAKVESARDRRIIAWAGFAPDFDVLAYAGAILYYRLDKDLAFENVWSVVHHRYTHGLSYVILTGIVAWLLASRDNRPRVVLLAIAVSALHNFLDIVAGGPTWPVYPGWPLSDLGWTVDWSWTLAEWPNVLTIFSCLAATMLYARVAGRSPVECFGDRAERWFVGVTRQGMDGVQRAPAGANRQRVRIIIWIAVVFLVIVALAPLGFNPYG